MILYKWFHEDHMLLNPGKCHYIMIGDNDPSHKIILIYNDYKLFFDRILEDNKHKSIHQKNIESLAIEVYRFQADLIPQITRENNCNLRNFQELESSLKRTVIFGTETFTYRGPQIRNLIPKRLRKLETLNKFKKEIKKMEVWCLPM